MVVRNFIKSLIFLSVVGAGGVVQASPEREFIMSCTYGVLAGTLVGAALLAFEDKPADNLQLVARGASIGLYMGIGLGYYTAFAVPNELQKEENEAIEGGVSQSQPSALMIFPLVANNKIDGAGFAWHAWRF